MVIVKQKKNNKKLPSKSSQVNVEEKQIPEITAIMLYSKCMTHVCTGYNGKRDRKALKVTLGLHELERFPGSGA